MDLDNIHKLGLIGLIISILASMALHIGIDSFLPPFWKGLLWLIIIIALTLVATILLIRNDDKKRVKKRKN